MKRNLLLLILFALANFDLLWGQSVVALWKWAHSILIFPELRYYVQSLIFVLPLMSWLMLKWRYGRKALFVVGTALLVCAVIYLVKAHIPGSRRNQYIAACNWAADVIRNDYHGPVRDAENVFTWLDYHTPNRPVVDAHVTRVSYLLGGRGANLCAVQSLDIPDYIVDEPHKVNREWWWYANFQILTERKFGKRNFVIYKRVK